MLNADCCCEPGRSGVLSVIAMFRQLASCQIPMPERMAGMALLVAGCAAPFVAVASKLLSEGTPSFCLPFVTQNDATKSRRGFCNSSSESEHGAEMASAPLAASRCLAELLRHVVGIDCRVKFRIVLRLFDRDRISLRSRFQTYLHRFFSHMENLHFWAGIRHRPKSSRERSVRSVHF